MSPGALMRYFSFRGWWFPFDTYDAKIVSLMLNGSQTGEVLPIYRSPNSLKKTFKIQKIIPRISWIQPLRNGKDRVRSTCRYLVNKSPSFISLDWFLWIIDTAKLSSKLQEERPKKSQNQSWNVWKENKMDGKGFTVTKSAVIPHE